MEFFVSGNIQGWGDGRLKISIFGAIWCHWGHMDYGRPLVPLVPLGPTDPLYNFLKISFSYRPEMEPNMRFTQILR